MSDMKKTGEHDIYPEDTASLTEEEMAFFSMVVHEEERPVVEEKVEKMRKTFLVPTQLVARLDEFCANYEVKKTDAITVALEEFLMKYK